MVLSSGFVAAFVGPASVVQLGWSVGWRRLWAGHGGWPGINRFQRPRHTQLLNRSSAAAGPPGLSGASRWRGITPCARPGTPLGGERPSVWRWMMGTWAVHGAFSARWLSACPFSNPARVGLACGYASPLGWWPCCRNSSCLCPLPIGLLCGPQPGPFRARYNGSHPRCRPAARAASDSGGGLTHDRHIVWTNGGSADQRIRQPHDHKSVWVAAILAFPVPVLRHVPKGARGGLGAMLGSGLGACCRWQLSASMANAS